MPKAHSTHPKSGPNERTGVLIAKSDLPSRRRDSDKELNKNSFSGIEGEGGRGMVALDESSRRERLESSKILRKSIENNLSYHVLYATLL